MSRSRVTLFLIPAVLVLVAGLLRVVNLDHPGRIIFDEVYYVDDALDYLAHGVEDNFAVHPPVGKWLIAAGIALFGDGPFGWRIAGAVAGTLVVLLTYLIGVRLLRWRGAAALAALLAAVDGLLFTQSRIAMLDVFLGLFVALGAWLLLVDHDRSGLAVAPRWSAADQRGDQLSLPVPAGGSADQPSSWHAPTGALDPGQRAEQEQRLASRHRDELPVRGHPLRLLAGLAFGLAVATKWSGVLALAAGALVVIGWELAWRRAVTGRVTTRLARLVGGVAVAFAVVPLAVYLVSYVPWLVNYGHTTVGEDVCSDPDDCHVSLPGRLAGLARYQVDIAEFHAELDATHTYRSPARTWPVLGRPIVYYWENCPPERASGIPTTNSEGELETPDPCYVAEDNAGEIIALGNPALWWGGLLAFVPLVVGGVTRDRRAWYLLAFYGVQFVPWLLVQRPLFFFYMTPVVPFLALIVAYATGWLDETVEALAARRGRPLRLTGMTPGAVAGAVVAVLAVGLFIYFYPVYAGLEMDYDAIRQRWWFDSWI